MGPPLKAGERWPPWVGDGGITHYLWTSSSPGGPFWVWKQTLKFLPSTPRFQDLILESSGRKANALAMSYQVLLLRLVENDYQNKKISQSKYFTVIILDHCTVYSWVHSTHEYCVLSTHEYCVLSTHEYCVLMSTVYSWVLCTHEYYVLMSTQEYDVLKSIFYSWVHNTHLWVHNTHVLMIK